MNPYRTEDRPKETPKMLTKDQADIILCVRLVILAGASLFVSIVVGFNTNVSYGLLVFLPPLAIAYHLLVDNIKTYE